MNPLLLNWIKKLNLKKKPVLTLRKRKVKVKNHLVFQEKKEI